ncbi:hypothetical protein Gotur_020804 [Gossypium turneri]
MYLCDANDLITIFVAPVCYYEIFSHGWGNSSILVHGF